MITREADRPLQRFVRSARPVSLAAPRTYTTFRDTTTTGGTWDTVAIPGGVADYALISEADFHDDRGAA